MTEHLFARAVVDRSEISVVANRDSAETSSGVFDVFIDGMHHGAIKLGLYYLPSIGVYRAGEIGVWAGNRAAVKTSVAADWMTIALDEPIHAMYRLRRGWCVVAELSVVTLDDGGAVVSRRSHREVIVGSRWEGDVLFLNDFEGNALTVNVDADTLRLDELSVRRRDD